MVFKNVYVSFKIVQILYVLPVTKLPNQTTKTKSFFFIISKIIPQNYMCIFGFFLFQRFFLGIKYFENA